MIRWISENLAKLFIRDYSKVHSSTVRSQYGLLEGWLSVIINLIIGLTKIFLATVSGSIALLADGIHSLTDMGTSIIVIISFIIGRRPSDYEHPFGHGRMEQIAALIIAVLLGVSGYELIKSSIGRIFDPSPVRVTAVIIAVLLITILLKELLGQISKYFGKKIDSIILEADSWHHRADALSSIIVIIAIGAVNYGFSFADGAAGIFIGLFILYIGYDIAKRTSFKLMGTRPSQKLLQEVESLVLENKDVLAIHEMICHEYGPQKVISFHLEVPSTLNIQEAHTIAERTEQKVEDELQILATVHIDPVQPFVKNRKILEEFLDSFVAETEELKDYGQLRIVGEEDYSTLVVDIGCYGTLSDKKIMEIKNSLQKSIQHSIPNIRNFRVNFL